MTRRVLGIGVAVVVTLALLVAVGRWEEHRAARKEMAGMRSVLAAIGGDIDSPRLSGYRYGPPDCLAYHDKTMLLALQLCFDSEGRLIQCVDRRRGAAALLEPRVRAVTEHDPLPTCKDRQAAAARSLGDRLAGR